jgi:hypothetical protein
MSRFSSIMDLPPGMREQARIKLTVRTVKGRDTVDEPGETRRHIRKEAENELGIEAKPTKYNAYRVRAEIKGKPVIFDSRHEYGEYLKLALREKAGEIENLQTHVKFSLFDPGGECRGQHWGTYKADFVYKENGLTRVADAKSEATRARRDWKRTKQTMKACHGYDVIEL